MKKLLLALAGVALLAVGFTSCGDKPTVEPTPEEVTPVSTDVVVDFAAAEISEAYGNSSLINLADGVLTITAGSWDSFTIAFASPIDISAKTKIVVNAKYDGTYTDPDAMVIGFVDSDDVQSRLDSWTVSGFMNPLSDTATDYEAELSSIAALEYRDGGDTTGANKASIAKIVIDPRGASGNIVISSIKFVD